MWNVKSKVTLVIIGVNGTSSKSFRKYLNITMGKCEIKELQQRPILGIGHISQKVLK
jgi:hypothetical protein